MLKEFCEVNSTPEPIIASSNVVYIELNSNPMFFGSQFLLEWSTQIFTVDYNVTTPGIIESLLFATPA
jgi:hypothetical protein